MSKDEAKAGWLLRPLKAGGDDIVLHHDFSIGRDQDCDLVLGEQHVSRKQASFLFKGDALFIRDHSSANGTFVNDERIDLIALQSGDRLRFDAREFQIVRSGVEADAESDGASQQEGMQGEAEGGRVLIDRTAFHRRVDKPLLTGLSEAVVNRSFALAKPVNTLGRADTNDIVLSAPAVSSQHAEICREEDGWVLYDRNSSNGTLVNGSRVEKARLKPGDLLVFGDVALVFDRAGTS